MLYLAINGKLCPDEEVPKGELMEKCLECGSADLVHPRRALGGKQGFQDPTKLKCQECGQVYDFGLTDSDLIPADADPA